jgi:protein involved in polysaccharide export with SLBB domain
MNLNGHKKYPFKYVILAVFILCSIAPAQISRIDFLKEKEDAQARQNTESAIQENEFQKARLQARKDAAKGLTILNAIGEPIDTDKYILGPGDIIGVNIIGSQAAYFELLVGLNNHIDIPGIASINAENLAINQLETEIRTVLARQLKIDKLSVQLIDARLMKIYLSGAFETPGAFSVKATERVMDVIQRFGGLDPLARLDKIEIRHTDSTTTTINGFSYYLDGEMAENPFLQSGDLVFIPKAKLSKETITIQGAVKEPGLYPHIEGEKLSQFFKRFNHFEYTIDPQIVIVSRRQNGENISYGIDLSGRNDNYPIKDIELQAGDHIELGAQNEVYVQGMVQLPGSYPFISGYQAIDYIGMAGGSIEETEIRDIKILRTNGDIIKDLNAEILRGDIVSVPSQEKVYVQGRVELPGAFPFVEGFRAIDYIGMAGGSSIEGNLNKLIIVRKNGDKKRADLSIEIQRGDVLIIPEKFSHKIIGDMSLLEIVGTLISTTVSIGLLQYYMSR